MSSYALVHILNSTKITDLRLYRNLIGDEGIMDLANEVFLCEGCSLQKLDASSCRITDQGLIYLLDKCQYTSTFT